MLTPASFIFNRNIRTHHAEDGSGVGSAIIAGKCIIRRLRNFDDTD
jgi:hypothetical protein